MIQTGEQRRSEFKKAEQESEGKQGTKPKTHSLLEKEAVAAPYVQHECREKREGVVPMSL